MNKTSGGTIFYIVGCDAESQRSICRRHDNVPDNIYETLDSFRKHLRTFLFLLQ